MTITVKQKIIGLLAEAYELADELDTVEQKDQELILAQLYYSQCLVNTLALGEGS